MSIFLASLKETLKSTPFVLNQTNKYFGFGFFAFFSIILFFLSYFLIGKIGEEALSNFISSFSFVSVFLANVFTMFICPYYAFKFSKRESIRPFWTFIADTIWPLVLSHIKAFFIILLFSLLLIIPGFYKAIQYSFINQSLFFDKAFKQGKSSALKASKKTVSGFWVLVCLSLIGVNILGLGLVFLFNLSFKAFVFSDFFSNFTGEKGSFLPFFLQGLFALFMGFYWNCLSSIFKTQFYFEISKQKGVEISC